MKVAFDEIKAIIKECELSAIGKEVKKVLVQYLMSEGDSCMQIIISILKAALPYFIDANEEVVDKRIEDAREELKASA